MFELKDKSNEVCYGKSKKYKKSRKINSMSKIFFLKIPGKLFLKKFLENYL